MSKKQGATELDIPLEIIKLRQRWELASVLNFLSIFEQVIGGDDLNLSAEEIETALIGPNASLSKLHVTLLKGIPPVNKRLSSPNVWVTVLCKKLAEWWPWVAEGSLPLTAAKGEEISRYKELDPITRLQMLKALCELRLEQNDMIDYINEAQKEGRVSSFRKDKIAEDGTGVSFWYDGNSVIGHRLYKEVTKSHSKSRHKRKGCSILPPDIEWETLATNLDEFRKVLEQLSSRKAGVESVVYKFIETEVIPVLEQLQKKKERALKRQQRQETLLNGYQPYTVGVTRSCRNRKPVSYTFDEFDRTIDEALKISRNRQDTKVERSNGERNDRRKRQKCNSEKDDQSCDSEGSDSDEDMQNDKEGEGSDNDEDLENEREGKGSDNDEDVENEQEGEDSDNDDEVENEQEGEGGDDNEEVENEQDEKSASDEDVENEQEGEGSENDEKLESEQECEGSDNNEKMESEQEREGSESEEDVNSTENAAESEDGKNNSSENVVENSSDLESENDKPGQRNCVKLHSEKNGRAGHGLRENRNLRAKNRLRQRPTRNTAIKSSIVPDSEDSSSENPSASMTGSGDPSEVADSESDGSS